MRNQRQLFVGHAHQNGDIEDVEELNATRRRSDVPGPMLKIEPDPIVAGAPRRLGDQRIGDREPAAKANGSGLHGTAPSFGAAPALPLGGGLHAAMAYSNRLAIMLAPTFLGQLAATWARGYEHAPSMAQWCGEWSALMDRCVEESRRQACLEARDRNRARRC